VSSVEAHFEQYWYRLDLFNELKDRLGSPIEWDSFRFGSVSFIVFQDHLPVMIRVSVPNRFPERRPQIRCVSLFRTEKGLPKEGELKLARYEQDWSAQILVQRILTHLPDIIQELHS